MNPNSASKLSHIYSTLDRMSRSMHLGVESYAHFWRQAQLVSGLILFGYVTTHLINHAVGIYSLAAMNATLNVFVLFWRFPLMQIALYGAFLFHILASFRALYLRKSFKMPVWQWGQVISGLLIPVLVADHIIGARAVTAAFDLPPVTYSMIYNAIWPGDVAKYILMILLVWAHGCVGMHFWLRHRPGYRRYRMHALAFAVGLPILSSFGVIGAGVESELMPEQAQLAPVNVPENRGQDELRPKTSDSERADLMREARDFAESQEQLLLGVLGALLGMIGVAHGVHRIRRSQGAVVSYGNGLEAGSKPGMTLLEISRYSGIPHASVCGGRGRCSTCRVLVSAGAEHLKVMSDEERKVLQRINAPDGVRLACQIRPKLNLSVTRLVPPESGAMGKNQALAEHQGVEQTITILFSDLRGFTTLSEPMLPFDVVFLLNQYFQTMTFCIEEAGGTVDKFIGDGIMAIFGAGSLEDNGARQAIAAASAMSAQLVQFNKDRRDQLGEELRMGIGVHTGQVIYGAMGAGLSLSLTAIGDAVNVASRLESATKEHKCQIIISEDAWNAAQLSSSDLRFSPIAIKGRSDISVTKFPTHENLDKYINQIV